MGSSFDDMLPGTEFKRMILDNGPASENPAAVQKILFCTGKVYYDLLKERKDAGLEDKIAIHTIEQICPLPRHWKQGHPQEGTFCIPLTGNGPVRRRGEKLRSVVNNSSLGSIMSMTPLYMHSTAYII